jgi:hypothetical protein
LAETVTDAKAGAVAGGVYLAGTPLAVFAGLIVPQPGEQAAPFWVRLQVTPLLVPSFVTVGKNCCVAVSATLAEAGDKLTVIGRSVIDARPRAALFVTEAACRNMPANPKSLVK